MPTIRNRKGLRRLEERFGLDSGGTVIELAVAGSGGGGGAGKDNVVTVSDSTAALTLADITVNTAYAITLTNDCAITFPTVVAGVHLTVGLIQDATGSRSITVSDTVNFGQGGDVPTLTGTPGRKDYLSFVGSPDASTWDETDRNLSVGPSEDAGIFEVRFTQIAADDFQRANGTLEDANWLATNDGSLAISSDEVTGTASTLLGNYRSGTYSADQYSEWKIGSVNGVSGGLVGVTTRNQGDGQAYRSSITGSTALHFEKRSTSGDYTTVGGRTITALSEGDSLGLRSEGARHVLYSRAASDGTITVLASYFDNSLTGGTPGISMDGAVETMGTWTGGNVHTDALPSAIATDSFTYASGTGWISGTDWVEMSGYPAVVPPVENDELVVQTVTSPPHAAIVRTDTFGADQFSGIGSGTVALVVNSGGFRAPLTRVNNALDSGYFFAMFAEGAAGTDSDYSYRIYRLDAQTSIFLAGADAEGSGTTDLDPTTVQIAGLSQGNRHALWLYDGSAWSEILSVTDNTYSTGQPGLMLFPSTSPTTADNWFGGNL